MSAPHDEALSTGAAMPAVVGPVRYPRRSRDLEDWERAPLAELGQILRDARLARGRELSDLGPIVGSRDSLEAIENGHGRTRADRLIPWLTHLGIADPAAIVAKYASVIAPPSGSGRPAWRPVPLAAPRVPRALAPPLEGPELASFGAALWKLRATAGLSRPALAARLGCSRVFVFLVERGARYPSEELADAWLETVGRAGDRDLMSLMFPGRIRSRRHASGPRSHGELTRSTRSTR